MSEEQKSKKEMREEAKLEKNERKQKEERDAMVKKVGMWAGLVLIVVLIVWGVKASRPSADEIVDLNPDPGIGSEDAAVVVKEYSDFQCPACQALQPVLKDIVEEYSDRIRFEYNDFPLSQHEYATTAAIGAECAFQQDNFFDYHDTLFENQEEWAASETEDDAIEIFTAYASDLGLDMEAFSTCTTGQDAADRVNEDYAEGIELGVNATPTVFVDGERITETPISISVREAIDAALGESKPAPEDDTTIEIERGGDREATDAADDAENE